MNAEQRRKLKEQIIQEITRIQKDIEGLTELTQPVSGADMDEATRMGAIVNKSVNDAALASFQARHTALEYALKQADTPEFGYCVDCGERIPLPRLLAMPEAARCVHCAT